MKRYMIVSLIIIAMSSAAFGCDCCQTGKKGEKTVKMDHRKLMQNTEHSDHDSLEGTVYYTCPMESHRHIISSEPGKCVECGMTLIPVEVSADRSGEPEETPPDESQPHSGQ